MPVGRSPVFTLLIVESLLHFYRGHICSAFTVSAATEPLQVLTNFDTQHADCVLRRLVSGTYGYQSVARLSFVSVFCLMRSLTTLRKDCPAA